MGFDIKDLEQFGKGYALPKKFTGTSTTGSGFRVTFEAVLENGRFECNSLTVERAKGAPPITTAGIRRIPVQSVINQVALGHLHRVKQNPNVEDEVIITPLRGRVPTFKRLAESGPTDEVLEHVALWYRLMYACNFDPTWAVEDAFGLPRSTAERWVRKARDLGLIDRPDPRRRK
jgi:hypothetical protein